MTLPRAWCRACRGEGWTDDDFLCGRCHGSGDDDIALAPDGDPDSDIARVTHHREL